MVQAGLPQPRWMLHGEGRGWGGRVGGGRVGKGTYLDGFRQSHPSSAACLT